MKRRTAALILCALLSVLTAGPVWALSDAESDEVAAEISRHLERAYPLPDWSKAYAAMLAGNVMSGRYHGLSPCALAENLTRDLRAAHMDLHLHVSCTRDPDEEGAPPAPGHPADRPIDVLELDPALPVAYIRSSGGWDLTDRAFAQVAHAMGAAAGSRYVIIDIRDHPGGHGEIGTLIASYFLPPGEAVPLVDTQRRGAPSIPETSYPFVSGDRLDQAQLFILVNERTGSAAEGLAFALQRRKRALIVGQKTAGAGIAGYLEPLGHGLNLYLPDKLILGPDSGPGWEGVGVKPDIVTAAGEERDAAMKIIRSEQPFRTPGNPQHPHRVTPAPDLTQAPDLVDQIESCETKAHDEPAKRVAFTNHCNKALSLQFRDSSQPDLEWRWQLEPGDMVSFMHDPEEDDGWWIAAACPLGYVSAPSFRADRREAFMKSRYRCIRESLVE